METTRFRCTIVLVFNLDLLFLSWGMDARDEIGILPFLPDREESSADSGGGGIPSYPFVVQERGSKLGIPIYCWVPLLDASNAAFKNALRAARTGTQDSSSNATTATAIITQQDWLTDPEKRRRVIESTSCLMILCPDSFTAVNARKRLVEGGYMDARKELQYLDMILTFPRNCKSSGAWHHRKWLLCYLFKDYETVPLDPSIVKEQLQVCHLAAERYPKCYYAWTMRHWLVDQLGRHWWEASLDQGHEHTHTRVKVNVFLRPQADEEDMLLPLLQEFERMKTHVQRNVSDHSSQQHLQRCMIQLSGKWTVQQQQSTEDNSGASPSGEMALQWTRKDLVARRQRRDAVWIARSGRHDESAAAAAAAAVVEKSRVLQSAIRQVLLSTDVIQNADEIKRASFPWVVQLWVSELDRVRNLITTYPGHESLWYHLRFVYYGLRWLDGEMDLDERGGNRAVELGTLDSEDGLFVSLATEDEFVKQLALPDPTTTDQDENRETDDVDILSEEQEQQRHCAERYLTWVKRLDVGCDP
ncbi:hypothetical protein BC939DRAFT_446548 [Gamsiella multidivaricata]|uniref:uncharacterized protein n=1 Tax=Gamsiella multidivaricata TaxID=101098 RepID=UPI00221F11CA|nr:uncharacterized protein BC939DRAFT_446548 [Gamsiella multidivaricata]KAI7826495.1 hypothetical protein BC939DRAFT_446548 [Gamsiella multidivaricata]